MILAGRELESVRRRGQADLKAEFHPEHGVPYFCVVGTPISHSRSPQIHQHFAAQFNLRLTYERVEVAAGGLRDALREFREIGGQGMNVTVPLKEEACRLADRVRPAASEAGAANTLWFDADGSLVADNTDGVGLVNDLCRNLGFSFAGKRVLMLGAGGAARGVLPVILRQQPLEVVLQNRTLARASALARAFEVLGRVTVEPLGTAARFPFDLVLNATSGGLSGAAPELGAGTVGNATWCYDMVYGPRPTAFLVEARRRGCGTSTDGLGMLVEQAARAFAIWHGREPQTPPVITAVRNAMAATPAS